MLQRTRLLRSNCEKLMYVSKLTCTSVTFQPYDFSWVLSVENISSAKFSYAIVCAKNILTSKISQTTVHADMHMG